MGRFVLDLIADPARMQELINPEFVPDGPFLLCVSERGHVGYRYDALPAAVAAEPTAFGCIFVEDERHDCGTALVAMLWDGLTTRLHEVSPAGASNTPTVAEAGDASSVPGGGLSA